MSGAILNIKFGLFAIGAGKLQHSTNGKLEKIGLSSRLQIRDCDGDEIAGREWSDGAQLTHEELMDDVFAWASSHLPHKEIAAAGHRVVRGSMQYSAPALVDQALLHVCGTSLLRKSTRRWA